MEQSSFIEIYNTNNLRLLDFTRLNSERFDPYTQLDIRVDKTWYYKKWSINFYIDIQNVYASLAQ